MILVIKTGTGTNAATQRGQALTEFMVVALLLIPMLLLMPLIAKYQDIVHATQMASRYVAFEAMTRNDGAGGFKPEGELANDVRRRFFSNTDAPIKTGDTAGNFKAHRNLFWTGPTGDALIDNLDTDVRVSFGKASGATNGDAWAAAVDGAPFALRKELGLQAKGIYAANVSVTLANPSADLKGYTDSYQSFHDINLHITRHTGVLVDGWAAKDPAQVIARIDKTLLFPGRALALFKPVVDTGVALMESPKYLPGVCINCGPRIGELQFWSDTVPSDRVK